MESNVPKWYRFAWFLGRPPPLSTLQWKILGLVAAVSIFEQYDVYLFALNLKQIQAELLIAESDLGLLGALVRAGSFFAIFFALAADRWGRRRLLLITVVGYTLLTGATALSPNAETFVLFQFLARGFATAEIMIAAVVIAEEFPREHRGWGLGALAALQALGAGLAALAFMFVESVPFGWRSLYALGLIPLLLIIQWRRTLPETGRFQVIATSQKRESYIKPLLGLLEQNPKRSLAVFSITFIFAIASSSAGFFAPKYLQDIHSWTPASVGILNIIGGAFAIIANPLAGRLSDRKGRRPIAMIFAVCYVLSVGLFYSASGMVLPLFWVIMIFFVFGSDVTQTTYGTELFPTSQRSTASGFRSVVGTMGGIIGLSSVSALFLVFESNWTSIVVLSLIGLLIPFIVWLFLPETANRSLEDISSSEARTDD